MTQTPPGSRWRWLLAGTLVVVALVAAILGVVETCDETALATETGVQVVEVCRSASLLEPRYLLVLIIATLLIWPDLSEISVGAFSIKKRLEHAETEQRALKGQVERLTQTIQMNQTTVVRVEPVYLDPVALRAESEAVGLPPVDNRVAGEQTPAEATVEILRKHERLRLFDVRSGNVPDSMEFIKESGPSRRALIWAVQVADLWPEAVGLGAAMCAEQARVFSSNFTEMLDGVRAVRNSIAHGKHVADDDLLATHSLVQALESFLLNRFEHWRSLDQGQDLGLRIGTASLEPDA